MTARPDAAPGGAEGQGSWADKVRCFKQSSMRERIKYVRAVGINMKQNNQENNNIFLDGWKARGIPKGGFRCVLEIKSKKVKSFHRLEGTTLVGTGSLNWVFWSYYHIPDGYAASTKTELSPLTICTFPIPTLISYDNTCDTKTIFHP